MELLQLTDENGYLPLPLTGDQDTLTLVGESPFTARRLVLTDEETLALKEAFTALALPQESVFWSLLKISIYGELFTGRLFSFDCRKKSL